MEWDTWDRSTIDIPAKETVKSMKTTNPSVYILVPQCSVRVAVKSSVC